MAAGFPVKANYATGDVLTATNMNDLAGTVNYIDPTGKTNGYVLTRNSSATGGLEWAAVGASGGGYTLLSTTSLSGSSTSVSISSTDYVDIYAVCENFVLTGAGNIGFRINNVTTTEYHGGMSVWNKSNVGSGQFGGWGTSVPMTYYDLNTTSTNNSFHFFIRNYNSTARKNGQYVLSGQASDTANYGQGGSWTTVSASAVTSVQIVTTGSNISGTLKIYGVK